MNIYKSLIQMISDCKLYDGFRGAFFTDKLWKVSDLTSHICTFDLDHKNIIRRIRIKGNVTIVDFDNGSYFEINIARDGVRGKRYNRIVIDQNINDSIIDHVILPYLSPYYTEDGIRYPLIPVTYCNFENISEQFDNYEKENKNMIAPATTATLGYGTLVITNDAHTRPFKTIDKDNRRILLYHASGIDTFEYGSEFINRTKETYLNVKGECDWYDGEYNNSVNIHLKIDTDVYDRFEVVWAHGILEITLYEIINEAPKFAEIAPFEG